MLASFYIKNHHVFEFNSTHPSVMTMILRTTSFEFQNVLVLNSGWLEQFRPLPWSEILYSSLYFGSSPVLVNDNYKNHGNSMKYLTVNILDRCYVKNEYERMKYFEDGATFILRKN